jgi:hypothetical protein
LRYGGRYYIFYFVGQIWQKGEKKGVGPTELLEAASHKVLPDLILALATKFPEVRQECFEHLKSQVLISFKFHRYHPIMSIVPIQVVVGIQAMTFLGMRFLNSVNG